MYNGQYIILAIIFSSPLIGSQLPVKAGGNVAVMQSNDSLLINDSAILQTDSLNFRPIALDSTLLVTDSLTTDTVARKKDAPDAPVDYTANDSIVFTVGNFGYLDGDAEVNYKEIKLKAENISMSMDSSIVHATFGLDSIGAGFG
mgnify:CR=1 FL=1